MVCERIMPLIWNIFHFLRIISKPDSGCINKIVFTMWVVLIITVGLFICYIDFFIYGETYTVSETVTFLLIDTLIPLQSLLVIKELASMAELQRDFKSLCLYPKHPFYYLIITSYHFTSLLIIIYYLFTEASFYSGLDQCYYVAMLSTMLLFYILNFLLISAARLVIGVAVSRLCKGIEDCLLTVGMENIQITICPMISEYKLIKAKLSSLLFTSFTVDTILLTAFSYYIAMIFTWGYIPYLFYIMLHLFYIANVLDESYSALKSSLPTLR